MKKFLIICGIALVSMGTVVFAMSAMTGAKSWRYKMTVTVETPDGDVSGSAVREMSNSTSLIRFPDIGNPANVKGEAVVVDLGKRGVLFALISSDSDMEFYAAYRELWSGGGSTPEGIDFYSKMPVGTKGALSPDKWPGYPKLVTFTDINDPKSVTLVQEWTTGKRGMILKADHFEELFGEGVKLKGITLEITDEPVTWGVVDEWLPNILLDGFKDWWKTLSAQEKMKISDYLQFKQGEPKWR